MGDGKRKFRRGMGNQTRSSRFVILDYRSPEGLQSIDNTEEFESVQRCVDEGKDPYEGRHSYYGFGMRRKHLSEPTAILNYRSPEGSQSIDNTEEFERVQRCVDEGKDPYEGRHSYCGFGMRRKHLSEPMAILKRPRDRDRRYSTRRRGSETISAEPYERSREDSGR